MKYRTVWRPGGRPRGGMGSKKPQKRKLQALKPRGVIPGKEVDSHGQQAA